MNPVTQRDIELRSVLQTESDFEAEAELLRQRAIEQHVAQMLQMWEDEFEQRRMGPGRSGPGRQQDSSGRVSRGENSDRA